MPGSKSREDKFYEGLAPLYHLKVDWQKRLAKEMPLFDHIFSVMKVKDVCDLGCGDGGHAQHFISRDCRYLGLDNSAAMIKMAKSKYVGVSQTTFVKGDMLDLPRKYSQKFDLVLLLGNTLPHLLDLQSLRQLQSNVAALLKSGGRFVIQTVNPGALLGRDIFFLPAKFADSALFAPFYVRRRSHWDFFMPIFKLADQKIEGKTVLRTGLHFWGEREIRVAAAKASLKVVEIYGDATLSPYDQLKSDNLIMILEKA